MQEPRWKFDWYKKSKHKQDVTRCFGKVHQWWVFHNLQLWWFYPTVCRCSVLDSLRVETIKHIDRIPFFVITFSWVRYSSTLTNENTTFKKQLVDFMINSVFCRYHTKKLLFIHTTMRKYKFNVAKNFEASLPKFFVIFPKCLTNRNIWWCACISCSPNIS